MSFIRSRIGLALIGLLLVGGIGAAVAVMTTPQPLRAALVGAGQVNGKSTAGSAPTATSAASGANTSDGAAATAPSAPTAPPPPPQATNPPASASGQVIDVKGAVTSVSASAGTFTMTTNGSSLTVVVTVSTQFSGDAKSLSALHVGGQAEVHGVMQANGSLLATEVNADSGN